MIAHLEAALRNRAGIDSTTLRLFDGSGDGLPGLLIDRLGSAIIIRLHEGSRGASEYSSDAALPLLLGIPGVESITLWRHSGDAVETTRQGAEVLHGGQPDEVLFEEHGLSFIARPLSTPSGGFFTDMRDVRSELRNSSTGKRVLNTFCFTGSLGIAALAGGAAEVVQLDISKSALTWARKNLERNPGVAAGEMRFIPDDTGTFLEREVRRKERGGAGYDTILIDPPAFGSSKGSRFVQETALPSILVSAFSILNPGGEIYLTSNRTTVTPASLEQTARSAAGTARTAVRASAAVLPPRQDFTARGTDSTAMRGVKISI